MNPSNGWMRRGAVGRGETPCVGVLLCPSFACPVSFRVEAMERAEGSPGADVDGDVQAARIGGRRGPDPASRDRGAKEKGGGGRLVVFERGMGRGFKKFGGGAAFCLEV